VFEVAGHPRWAAVFQVAGGWTTLTPGGVSANEGAKARMVSGEEIGGIMEARGEGGS